jgi:endonuclease YncB( thermonuclease family)
MRALVLFVLHAAAWLACFTGVTARAADTAREPVRAQVVAYASATAFAVLDPARKLRRIKLTGIDAPERKQRFAQEAQLLASQHLGAGPVEIEIDAIEDERIHGRVAVDGRDLGLVLLEAGLAWCDPADSGHLPAVLRSAYAHACAQARSERRGLWQDANPVPPWEYRKVPHFEPPAAERTAERHCRDIGYQSVQCDDGVRYRALGSRAVGSDGTVYSRRGNTISGSDGSRYEAQGTSLYGADGTVCRTRGRQTDCH